MKPAECHHLPQPHSGTADEEGSTQPGMGSVEGGSPPEAGTVAAGHELPAQGATAAESSPLLIGLPMLAAARESQRPIQELLHSPEASGGGAGASAASELQVGFRSFAFELNCGHPALPSLPI
jgi:hypothetical protein